MPRPVRVVEPALRPELARLGEMCGVIVHEYGCHADGGVGRDGDVFVECEGRGGEELETVRDAVGEA